MDSLHTSMMPESDIKVRSKIVIADRNAGGFVWSLGLTVVMRAVRKKG